MADNILAPQGGVTDPMMEDQQVRPDPTALDGDQSSKGPVAAAPTSGAPTQGDQSGQAPQQQQQQPGQQNQNGQSGQDDGTKPQQAKAPVTPAAPQATPATHPAVQKASLLHDVAQTLAGGPHFTTSIDPQTGVTTRTQIPVSGKQLAMAIALEALGGGIAGMGAKGPNNESQALQAGFRQGAAQQQQSQEAEEAQAKQANDDLVRQGTVAKTNFQTHQNAMIAGQMEKKIHDEYVGDAKPVLDNLNQVGAIKASGVREGDLMSKYNVTKDMAVVDGTVPRMNPDGTQATNRDGSLAWDNTYSVMDPDAKIGLPDATAQLLADHHVPGYFKMVDGKATPIALPQGQQLKARLVVDGLATASAIKLTEASVNQQLSKLAGGPEEAKQFQVNLTQGLESGSVSQKALRTFAQYSSVPVDQLRATMEKAKVDPDTVGQIMSLVPQDAVDTATKQRAADVAKQKADNAASNLVVSKTNYDEVLANKSKYSADQVSAAQSIDKQVRQEKASDSYNAGRQGEQGRIDAKKANGVPLTGAASTGSIGDMVKDPKVASIQVDPNEQPVNGVHTKYLSALESASPDLAAEVKGIGEGRLTMSDYGLAKKDGQALAAIVARAYPDYDQGKTQSYKKMRDSFTAGEDAKQIEAGNTTMLHAARFAENAASLDASIPGTTAYNNLRADAPQLVEELNSSYTKGVLHEDKREQLEKGLTSSIPKFRMDAIREYMHLLGDKIGQKQQTWQRGRPSPHIADFSILSDDARAAYKKVTGQDVSPSGIAVKKTPAGHAAPGTPQFTHYSSSGKFGWNGTQWVPTQHPQQQ